MKVCIILAHIALALLCCGFRVTKDYGYGVKTYEDSKRGKKGVSFDNGNSWITTKRGITPRRLTFSSGKTEAEKILETRMASLKKQGKLYVVKESKVLDPKGKRIDIAEKLKHNLQTKINWGNASTYVYLSSLKGTNYKTSDGEYARVYKILNARIGKWDSFCEPEKWKMLYKGYLMNAEDYAALNPKDFGKDSSTPVLEQFQLFGMKIGDSILPENHTSVENNGNKFYLFTPATQFRRFSDYAISIDDKNEIRLIRADVKAADLESLNIGEEFDAVVRLFEKNSGNHSFRSAERTARELYLNCPMEKRSSYLSLDQMVKTTTRHCK